MWSIKKGRSLMFNEKMEVYAAKTQPEVINVESQSQGIIEETQQNVNDNLPGRSHKENKSADIEVNKSLS